MHSWAPPTHWSKSRQLHWQNAVRHVYITPLEACNLRCKICYTRKTQVTIQNQEILDFLASYQKIQAVDSVILCGGEVFLMPQFPELVNTLTQQGLLVEIITNGTIDRLDAINQPNSVNLIVSLDGLDEEHDHNRGAGTFSTSFNFLKKAHDLGFHVEVFSILTAERFARRGTFSSDLAVRLGFPIQVTFHPRKPPTYLVKHPTNSVIGSINGFGFLNQAHFDQLKRQTNSETVFPPLNFGCYQIALLSDKKVYGCCESPLALGDISTPPTELLSRLAHRVSASFDQTETNSYLGCSDCAFHCGLTSTYELQLPKPQL